MQYLRFMLTKKILLSIPLACCLCLFGGMKCNKIVCDPRQKYSFEIGVKAFPDKDSVHVHDTIWLVINTPDTLIDLLSNELIEYSGVENLGSVISFQKLNGNAFTVKALNKFALILKEGKKVNNTIDTELFDEYLFSDKKGYYQFVLGMVPMEVGTFGIIVGSAANVYRESDKCSKASFTMNFKETNQHYYLNPNFQGGPIPVGGDYYFKVVE